MSNPVRRSARIANKQNSKIESNDKYTILKKILNYLSNVNDVKLEQTDRLKILTQLFQYSKNSLESNSQLFVMRILYNKSFDFVSQLEKLKNQIYYKSCYSQGIILNSVNAIKQYQDKWSLYNGRIPAEYYIESFVKSIYI